MRTLDDIFNEAVADRTASNLDTIFVKARMNCGYKIIKDGSKIRIFETHGRSDFYTELDRNDLNYFLNNGWIKSIFELSLLRSGEEINKIKSLIEKNGDPESAYSKKRLEEIESIKAKMQSIIKRKQTIK